MREICFGRFFKISEEESEYIDQDEFLCICGVDLNQTQWWVHLNNNHNFFIKNVLSDDTDCHLRWVHFNIRQRAIR